LIQKLWLERLKLEMLEQGITDLQWRLLEMIDFAGRCFEQMHQLAILR
jgi:hypothetical protein